MKPHKAVLELARRMRTTAWRMDGQKIRTATGDECPIVYSANQLHGAGRYNNQMFRGVAKYIGLTEGIAGNVALASDMKPVMFKDIRCLRRILLRAARLTERE